MKSWPAPAVPPVPGSPLPVRLHDTARGEVVELSPGPTARIYCCGITPYDATHMGHAATYVTFDLLAFYKGQHTYVGIDTISLSSVSCAISSSFHGRGTWSMAQSAPITSPAAMRGRYSCFCSSLPKA